MSNRPLSPRTLEAYQQVLKLAFGLFGPENPCIDQLDTRRISTWGNSALNQLKCAVRWYRTSRGFPAFDAEIEKALAPKYVVQKQVYTPSEFEMEQLERAANNSAPPARAAVLLMLYLGLRVEEFYSLKRRAVERAISSNLLTFTRKGGTEASLDVAGVSGILADLLAMPARGPRGVQPARTKKWETVGEIYSAATPHAQYQVIRDIVRRCFDQAGLEKMSPHKLRHAFATRMNRDGAPVFTIQAALNHKSVATTQKYVHAGVADVAKFMRKEKK